MEITDSSISYHKSKVTAQLAIEAFRSTGFLSINKRLINKFNFLQAVVISNYIDKYQYFATHNSNFDGWFFLRHRDIVKELKIGETTIIRIKKELIENGVIETKLKGQPSKEWIWINFDMLIDVVFSTPGIPGGLDPGIPGGLIMKTKTNNNTMLILKSQPEEEDKITINDFDKFWESWPSKRRGSKGKALSSWIKLCSPGNKFRPDWQRVRAAVIKQKKSDQWREEKFIPLASTWLNNKRWLDDPKELKRYRFANKDEDQNEYIENTAMDRRQEKEELEREAAENE